MDIEEIVLMHPDDIATRPPFSDLLPARDDVLNRIAESMKAGGFDSSHPVHFWRQGNCLIDGHTRCRAAKIAGVDVCVFMHDFEAEDDALNYAVRCQGNRRNLTGSQIVKLVQIVDRIRQRGGDKKSKAAKSKSASQLFDSAEETARALGISIDKVKKARAVIKDGKEAEAVLNGEKSLNKASKDAKAKKPKAAKPKPFNATEAFMKIHEYLLDALEKWPQGERRTFARKLLGVAEELKRETGLVMQEITIDAKAS